MYMLERSDLLGNIYPLATDEFFQNSYVSKFISLDGLNLYLRGVTGTTPKITLRLVLPQQNHSANPDSGPTLTILGYTYVCFVIFCACFFSPKIKV